MSKSITTRFPDEEAAMVKQAAKDQDEKLSPYIRKAIKQRIRRDRVDLIAQELADGKVKLCK
jgi:predicted transcriptional regulator